MAIAYSIGPFPFIAREDKDLPEELKTVFQLKNLTQDQWDRLAPQLGKGNAFEFTGPIATKIVKMVLAGWENFNDMDGNSVEYNGSNPKANLNYLSAGLRVQIANEAIRRNELTDDESKN